MRIDGNTSLTNPIAQPYASQSRREQAKLEDFQSTLNRVLSEKDDKKLKDACIELESVFVNEMLKIMRQSVSSGGLIPVSYGENVFRSMLDEEYAKIISKTGNLGLADTIYNQLKLNMSLAQAGVKSN